MHFFCLVFSFCPRGYFPDPMFISDFLLARKQGVERNRNHTERKKKHQINEVKRFLLKIPASTLSS